MAQFNIKLSELQKRKVVDADGVRVGQVVDVWLDEDASMWLVVGGGFLEETLERLHIRPDMDLLVPSQWIADMDDEIRLEVSKFQLQATCEEAWVKEKERLVRAHEAHDQNEPLRLMDVRIV